MAYGDTLSYTYEAEVENKSGEVELKKETLYFTYNANTSLIYKRLFDSNFLQDITKLTSSTSKDISSETLDKISKGELSINEAADIISESDTASQSAGIDIDTALITQIAVAMVATNDSVNGYRRRTVEEIANSLPDISTNIDLLLAIIEFITVGIKKKTGVKRRF